MWEHNLEEYCTTICPLLSKPHASSSWACQEHCDYEPERQVWLAAAPRSLHRRHISQFVKRDPGETYHAHPVQPWMYGVITGDATVDLGFPLPRGPDDLGYPVLPSH